MMPELARLYDIELSTIDRVDERRRRRATAFTLIILRAAYRITAHYFAVKHVSPESQQYTI